MKKILYIAFAFLLISCSSDSSSNESALASDVGQGGSLARFTIFNDYLYAVDSRELNVFNISNPTNPVQVNTVFIGFDIETLFNYKEYLYIGSRSGMFIYGLSNPENPNQLAAVEHFTACDPVVANNTHAFVTLDVSLGCGTGISALEIYDVTTVTEPVLISSRNLIAPKGLGLYNNYLFVCDDEIKIFDISNPEESVLVNSINKNAFDVIIQNDLLILIGNNGLYQYRLDANNIQNITELSTINI
ncbi:MAG: hypothetical protein L3J25_10610 [Flavobacteriaceae bacterium]|nr:hypothetical protein [Flavobacteriaceae bacterium]